jgi:hypothetical protein
MLLFYFILFNIWLKDFEKQINSRYIDHHSLKRISTKVIDLFGMDYQIKKMTSREFELDI